MKITRVQSETATGVPCIQFLITTYNRPGKHFYLLLSGTSWRCSPAIGVSIDNTTGGQEKSLGDMLLVDLGYSWGSAEAQDPTEVGVDIDNDGLFPLFRE